MYCHDAVFCRVLRGEMLGPALQLYYLCTILVYSIPNIMLKFDYLSSTPYKLLHFPET